MAISRAQLLKELLPGLNALFGMEYARYVKSIKKFMRLKPLSVPLKKRPNCLASLLLLLRTRALPSLMTMHKRHGQLATTTKLSL